MKDLILKLSDFNEIFYQPVKGRMSTNPLFCDHIISQLLQLVLMVVINVMIETTVLLTRESIDLHQET